MNAPASEENKAPSEDVEFEDAPPDTSGPVHTITVRASTADLIAVVIIGAVGIWFFHGAINLPIRAGRGFVQAGTFPILVSSLLLIGCAVVGIRAFMTRIKGEPEGTISIGRPAYLAIVAVLMVVYAYVVDSFGYYPTAAIFVAAVAFCAGIRSPLKILAIVAGFLVFAWAVFQKILGTPLPMGILS